MGVYRRATGYPSHNIECEKSAPELYVFKIGRMFFPAVVETETGRLIFGLGVSGVLVFARQGLLLKRKRTTDPKCRKRASGLV